MVAKQAAPDTTLTLPLSVEQCTAHDARVTACFQRHDVDKSGSLDEAQLTAALAELGNSARNAAELRELISLVDIGDDHREGCLSLREFHSLFDATRLRRTFDEVDAAGNGTICADELVAALDALGCREVSQEVVKRMLARLDKDHSGVVSWDEFYSEFEFVPLATVRRIADRWGELVVVGDSEVIGGPTRVPNHLTAWQTVVAGTVSSFASRTTTAPLERLKIDAQAGRRGDTLWAVAATILKAEGIAGFFRGNLLHCLRAFPSAVVTCAAYNALDTGDRPPKTRRLWQAWCTTGAAALAATLTYPLDSLRTRWITEKPSRTTSVLGLLALIVKHEGPRALFKGIAPTLYAIVPFTFVQSATLDFIRDAAAQTSRLPSAADLVFASALSSLAAQCASYPLDTVHRRMQIGPDLKRKRIVYGDTPMPDSTWPALRHIVKTEGFAALYRGLLPTCLKSVPSAAVGSAVAVGLIERFKASNDTDP